MEMIDSQTKGNSKNGQSIIVTKCNDCLYEIESEIIVEILRCWNGTDETKDRIYGEYYLVYDGIKYFVFQNENDIQILAHFRDKPVQKCVTCPSQKVIKIINKVVDEYLNRDKVS